MANRQEFTRDVRAQIKTRCLRPTGYACEKCGLILKSGGEIHHVKQDAMKRDEDKKRKLTAADGLFLCEPCHDAESGAQAPVMAKVKRQEAKHLGVATPPAKPLQSKGFIKRDKQPRIEKRHLPPKEMFR